jgi:hypothetical protein
MGGVEHDVPDEELPVEDAPEDDDIDVVHSSEDKNPGEPEFDVEAETAAVAKEDEAS